MPPTQPNRGHLESTLHEDAKQSAEFPVILMSEIFDLPRLSASIDLPIVEIDELKWPCWNDEGWRDRVTSLLSDFWAGDNVVEARKRDLGDQITHPTEWETIGCWSLEEISLNKTHDPLGVEEGKLQLEYTPLPPYVIDPKYPIPDGHALIASLANVVRYDRFGIDKATERIQQYLSGASGDLARWREWHPDWVEPSVQPDRKLACIDNFIYYTFAKAEFEVPPWLDREDYESNTWTQVGRYLRWRKDVKDLAMAFLRKGWGLTESEPMPPYVSVHIRRTGEQRCTPSKSWVLIGLVDRPHVGL